MFWQMIFISQFMIMFACWNRVRCSMNHLVCLLYLITYVRKYSHQRARSKVVCIDDVSSYKIWWHVKQLHAKFSTSSCCQCERDISKIINFCLTIAHETCDNELIKSFMNLKSSMFYFRFVNMFLSQSFIDQIEKFAHYQYYYTIFIDDHVWCTVESKNEITRKTNFSLSKIFRKIYNFSLKIIRKIHNFSLLFSVDRSLSKNL